MNWSMKSLIKKIVTSSTYKQSSKIQENKSSIDPNNLYYSMGPKKDLVQNQLEINCYSFQDS